MNKISSAVLALCLMCGGSLALAMEPMEKHDTMEKGAMTKDTMKKEPMTKDGAMMKAQPKKMEKQQDKMAPADKMEHGGGMAMEPKK